VLCKLRDWRLSSIELVGTQPLPGITYTHRFRNGGSKELPVLPSDHFGLLLRLEAV
jgi:tyrosyl-DNA phosphodiesterase 2